MNTGTTTGNVGIGETSPTEKLDVVGNIRANAVSEAKLIIENTDVQLSENQRIGSLQFKQNDTSSTGTGKIGEIRMESIKHLPSGTYYGESAKMIFSVGERANDNANIDAMTINRTGDVGIGTSSPEELLHITKSGTDNFIRIDAGSTGDYDSGIKLYEYDTIYGFRMYYDSQHDKLHIAADSNASTSSNKVTVLHGGNVGIGTDSPGEKLTENGSIQISGASSSTVTNESKIIFTRNVTDTDESENIAKIYTSNYVGPLVLESSRGNGYVKTIGNSAGNDPIFIATHYVDGERFRIGGNGRVGIGTHTPEAGLHVTTTSTQTVGTAGYLSTSGGTGTFAYGSRNITIKAENGHIWSASGSSFIVNSDKRIKENKRWANDR